METEKALFFVKPLPLVFAHLGPTVDAVTLVTEMFCQFTGMRLIEKRLITLTEQKLDTVYREIPQPILAATFEHLAGRRTELFVIEGKSANSRLVRIIGDHANPSLCSPGSIRRLLWTRLREHHSDLKGGIPLEGRMYYYHNYLHRSKNPAEFEAQYTILTGRK